MSQLSLSLWMNKLNTVGTRREAARHKPLLVCVRGVAAAEFVAIGPLCGGNGGN
jgi:predicted restriction endonuclease